MPICKFCKSKELLIPTGYLKANGEKETTPCCEAQRVNAEYIKKNYDPSRGRMPTIDEVSKL